MAWFSNIFNRHPDAAHTDAVVTTTEPSSAETPAEAAAVTPENTPATPRPSDSQAAAALAHQLLVDDWEEGQKIFDDFEIERKLGRGELGFVYLVMNSSINRRYVVKRIKFRDAESQREIMTELQNWIYMPEHPHIVACRFARTLNTEIAIFIERAEGRHLQEMIEGKQLYDGGPQKALERILSIAIQFAWALQGVHEMKLIHQNVKPSNLFVNSSGTARITDVGLRRAAALGLTSSAALSTNPSDSVLDYTAPELNAGGVPSVASDIFGWGVSVLAMFLGDLRWPERIPNEEVLERLLPAPASALLPGIPPEAGELLKRAIQPALGSRNLSPGEAAEALRVIYKNIFKKPFPLLAPVSMQRGSLLAIAHARWQPGGGVQWSPPDEWLTKARRAEGIKAFHRLENNNQLSKQNQAKEDLPGYTQALQAFQRLFDAGRKDLSYDYAILCFEKAFLHVSLNDLPNAVKLFDQTVKVLDEMVNKQGRTELANDLAMAYLSRAIALKHIGDLDSATQIYEKAIAAWRVMVEKEGRRELAGNLAWVNSLRGEVLFQYADRMRDKSQAALRQGLQLKIERIEMQDAQKTETDPAKLPVLKKKIEETNAQMDKLQTQATEYLNESRRLREAGQQEAREALALLKAEISRTHRDDLTAILRWANRVFENLL